MGRDCNIGPSSDIETRGVMTLARRRRRHHHHYLPVGRGVRNISVALRNMLPFRGTYCAVN